MTSSTAELNVLTGITSSTAELNILTGLTASTAELNILTGVSATSSELNYLDINTAGTAEASKALITDASNNITGLGSLGANTVNANNLTGTLDTSEQPNITSVGTLTIPSSLTILGEETSGAKLILRESTNQGVHQITIKAPSTLAHDYVYILPSDYGSASQFLQTDGSGGLVWANGGGGGGGIENISEASDVNITTPGNNELLAYNTVSNKWNNVSSISIYSLTLDGVSITASGNDINKLDGLVASTVELNILNGLTASTVELNYLDINTAGTAEASKALITDGSNNIVGLGDLGVNNVNANSLTGTLNTSEQPNITSVGTLTAPTSITILGQSTSGGKIILREATSCGEHTVSIQAPITLIDNYTLILPENDGDNGQLLTTNGNGVLSWTNGGSLNTNITSPNDQDLLAYNSETGTWNNLSSISVSGLMLNGIFIDATATEINILSGLLTTNSELNLLSGLTASANELNTLSGLTASISELNALTGTNLTQIELNTLSGIISTTDELNILSGVIATSTELNILSGVIATSTELNILSGLVATTSELNSLSGLSTNATELNTLSGVMGLTSTELNSLVGLTASATDLNALTGTNLTPTDLIKLSGLIASTDELNVLSGVGITTSELNTLSGIIATAEELNILSGVTATFDKINYLNIGAPGYSESSRALVSDFSNNIINLNKFSANNILIGHSPKFLSIPDTGTSGQLLNLKTIALSDSNTSLLTNFSNVNAITIEPLLLAKIPSGTITGTDCSTVVITGPPTTSGNVELTPGTTYALKVNEGISYLIDGIKVGSSGNIINVIPGSVSITNGTSGNQTAYFKSTITTNNSLLYTVSSGTHIFNTGIRNSGITLGRNIGIEERKIHMFIGPTVLPSTSGFTFSAGGVAPLVIQNMDASFDRFIWYSGSSINGMDFFTGQHGCTTLDSDIKTNINNYVGLIVSANGNYISPDQNNDSNVLMGKEAIQINNSLPMVELTTQAMDKKVFGVISNAEEVGSRSRSFGKGAWGMMISKPIGDDRLIINSVGEGGIWVSNINGNFENGDYITSSVIPGYGMKQNDDLLHNYTVGKITMECSFNNSEAYQMKPITHEGQSYICAFVGCTYHCG